MSCPHSAASRRARGFSLIELLIAAAIGSGIMLSLAATAHLLTEEVAEVTGSDDLRLEETVATLAQELRTAWAVSAVSDGELSIEDPFGNLTHYYLEQGALIVQRPSGAEGTLLTGVKALDFDLGTTARLRESAPASAVRTFWESPANNGSATMLQLSDGSSLALGFSVPVDAGSSHDEVEGVAEQVQSTTLTRLLLPVSMLNGNNKQFCHLHASQPHNTNHPGGQGVLTLDLYEARVPLDARPFGPRLATTSVSVAGLPAASYQWWDTKKNKAASPPSGVSWGWWKNNEHVVLVASPSASQAAINLSGLGTPLQPGRAYTLVLTVSGWDQVYVQSRPVAGSKLSGVALKSGGSWTPQARVITCSLEGSQLITQTSASAAVSSVSVTVQMEDGRTLSNSVNVAGQLAVDDPWLGALPGELPMLQLKGS